MENCVFCQIVAGEIPTKFVYQDDQIAVFPDLHPSAPLHFLFIPKKHVNDLVDADEKLIMTIKNRILEIVKERGLIDKGYRILVNGGKAKAIPHLHFHLLGEVEAARKI